MIIKSISVMMTQHMKIALHKGYLPLSVMTFVSLHTFEAREMKTSGFRQKTHSSCLIVCHTWLVWWWLFITLPNTILHEQRQRKIAKQKQTGREKAGNERERGNEFIITDGPGWLPASKAPAIWQRLHRRIIIKNKKKEGGPCGTAHVHHLKAIKFKTRWNVCREYCAGDVSASVNQC